MNRVKQLVISILDEFEQLLEDTDTTIPDEFREGDEGEARLFGDGYYRLEDIIYNMIYNEFIIKPIEFINKGELQ